MKKISIPAHAVFFTVLLLAATILTIEVFLQTFTQTSLCKVSSCRVVGEYVHFGELVLIQAGAAFFWLFLFFAFFAVRYPQAAFWHFSLLAFLYGSVAFDGALLGFQFIQLRTYCLICIGVGLGLFCVTASYAWWKKSWKVFLLAMLIWTSGFAANSILKWDSMVGKAPKLKESALLKTDMAVSGDYPAYHLFFSLHCSHCADLLLHLSVNNDLLISNGNWHLHSLDTEKEDTARLTLLTRMPEAQDNIFYAVLKAKELKDVALPVPDPKIAKLDKKARAFFTAGGYGGIPLLVVQVNPAVTLSFQGSDVILRWLYRQELIERQAVREPEKEAAPAAQAAPAEQMAQESDE